VSDVSVDRLLSYRDSDIKVFTFQIEQRLQNRTDREYLSAQFDNFTVTCGSLLDCQCELFSITEIMSSFMT